MYNSCNRFSKMYKQFYLFLTIVLLCCLQQNQSQVTKCCPIGSILNQSDQDHSFKCESSLNQTNWDAHNIMPSSLPNCTSYQNIFNGENTNIDLNGCVDKNSTDQFIAVNCSLSPLINVYLMNKCCPINQSYDYYERRCKNNPNTHQHFKHLIGTTSVVFDVKVPECPESEVFVEYISTHHRIQFIENAIEVNNNRLLPHKLCVDNLIINNSESKDNIPLIVRSCRSRSVCDEIPCIRRCCNADQILHPLPKGKRQCQNHPNKTDLLPIFHDVKLPLKSTQQEINLFGM